MEEEASGFMGRGGRLRNDLAPAYFVPKKDIITGKLLA
jgi:hypothetical protein